MSADLSVGADYLCRGRRVRLECLSGESATIRDAAADKVYRISATELAPITEPQGYAGSPLLEIDSTDWNRAARLAQAMREVLAADRGRTAIVKRAAQELGISERQAWRALKAFEQHPTVEALLPAKPGPRVGTRKAASEVEAVIAACIEDVYLKREKPTVAQLHRAIQTAARAKGLVPPAVETVRRRVRALDLREATRRRQGAKRAREVCDPAAGHVEVLRPLQRIEIDHTLVDIILRADTPAREVVGRPWLTLAVDVLTRMVVGFYIGFERPSAASVALCLARVAQDKAAWLGELGVKCDWPAQGIPEEIWVDNALEFRSEALKRGCQQHGIVLHFRPVGAPEVGGTIERLNGTVMGEVHLLPGTTQSNVIQRGDYDSEQRATLTLRDLVPWFAEQVASQYHLRPHRALRVPPLVAWQRGVAAHAPRQARDPHDFYVSFLPAQKRLLTRLGVQLFNQTYWAPQMSPWVGKKQAVLAHYHPMDMGSAHVRLPDGTLATAKAQRDGLTAVSLADWQVLQAADRRVGRDPARLAVVDAGAQRNRERALTAAKATLAAKRARTQPAPAPDPGPPVIPAMPIPGRLPAVVDLSAPQPAAARSPRQAVAPAVSSKLPSTVILTH